MMAILSQVIRKDSQVSPFSYFEIQHLDTSNDGILIQWACEGSASLWELWDYTDLVRVIVADEHYTILAIILIKVNNNQQNQRIESSFSILKRKNSQNSNSMITRTTHIFAEGAKMTEVRYKALLISVQNQKIKPSLTTTVPLISGELGKFKLSQF